MKKIVLRSAVATFLALTLSFCLWACKGKQGPVGVAGAPTTVYYVASSTPVVQVTTFAGSGNGIYADGAGNAASFCDPIAVAVDAADNVYVADTLNHRIRKITSGGVVTTLAGSGAQGNDDGTGTSASFNHPAGIAVDSSGNVYVADDHSHRIRKVTSGGVVTTLAGSGSATFADGVGTAASFNYPSGVAVDLSGNVYIADFQNNRIRKITASGVVSTLAGTGDFGHVDGSVTAASFEWPDGVAVDVSGNVYVADRNNRCIRKITLSGVVSTLAGSGPGTFADGTGTAAAFNYTLGVTVDESGNVYVADMGNNRIRKITPSGVVSTLAGSGSADYADGYGTSAIFNQPQGIAVDFNKNIFVADTGNNRIREIQISD